MEIISRNNETTILLKYFCLSSLLILDSTSILNVPNIQACFEMATIMNPSLDRRNFSPELAGFTKQSMFFYYYFVWYALFLPVLWPKVTIMAFKFCIDISTTMFYIIIIPIQLPLL